MKIKDLTEADKQRKVVYTDRFTGAVEEGVITSWNESYIFVRYGNDCGSKATDESNLEFI